MGTPSTNAGPSSAIRHMGLVGALSRSSGNVRDRPVLAGTVNAIAYAKADHQRQVPVSLPLAKKIVAL